MKLRNKKTGEIIDLARRGLLKSDNDNHIIVYPEGALKYYAYNSLAELNEEWEDCEPAEPLIKDEKIRKAVRAWAEVNDIEAGLYDADTFSIGCDDNFISFNNGFADETKIYTIAELCGEDEE